MQGQQTGEKNTEKEVDEEFSNPVPPLAVDEETNEIVERSSFRLSNKNNLNETSLQSSKNNVLFTTNILISHTTVIVKPTARAKMKWKFNVFDGLLRKCN
jgi:hypothetical protein